ncbi:J domain-containing protein [Pectobacterium peruviense]|uniref:Molecular chaperone DnaJ n=1 Tax=Pectobacterium peruviense TaxID=2066479 RepID=A0ABX4S7G8_9GAMM|nr:J domain-containing protein [Pectobacterium peruviense]KML71574.1 molecular chaperone DnaJ [Pectobacterium peruviense]PKX82116.1 molecular chaperone DnaJ [Pectobacterium peruviense]PKX85728.1 molecular chaperone DnaJ [Pectobacterium peruviense]
MDTLCWQRLGIEPTQDLDVIRQAYRQKVPQFHPETDPDGFKQLREAYDTACKLAKNPVPSGDEEHANTEPRDTSSTTEEVATDHADPLAEELVAAFEQLLSNPSERFVSLCWERYIQLLNQQAFDVIDRIRWPLLQRLMRESCISILCVRALADRLRWQQRQGELSGDEVEDVRNFLDSLGYEDLFDFSLLSHLSLPAQLETIFYFQQANGTYWNRPAFMLATLLRNPTAIYWPDSPALMQKLARWHNHASVPNTILRDYCLQQLDETPDDAEWLALSASLCSLTGEDERAFALWLTLYQQTHHAQAEKWLLDWCKQHRPDAFPLLVQSLNYTPAPTLTGLALDDPRQRFFISQHNTHQLIRWAEALKLPLSPMAESYARWKLGKQDLRGIYQHLLLHSGDAIQDRLYWHASMLTIGNERLLQDILAQPLPDEPLYALILQGLQFQATQRLSWLETSDAIHSFTEWLYSPSEDALPSVFTNQKSFAWLQAQTWLRQWRPLSLNQLNKLYSSGIHTEEIDPINDCLVELSARYQCDVSLVQQGVDKPQELSAREELRQAILIALMMTDPTSYLGLSRQSVLPELALAHPAHSLSRLFRKAESRDGDAVMPLKKQLDLTDPLHYHCWMNFPVAIEEYLGSSETYSESAASHFYLTDDHWQAELAKSPMIYQIFFHAFYALVGEEDQAEQHRERLASLPVETQQEEDIRVAFIEESDELGKSLKQLSDDKRVTLIGQLIQSCAKNPEYLFDNSDQRFLTEHLSYPHEDIALKLIAKVLLQCTDRRERQFNVPQARKSYWWQFWRTNTRIGRLGFLIQGGLGSYCLYRAGDWIGSPPPHIEGLLMALLVCNLLSAARRRYNDIGSNTPWVMSFFTLLIPLFLLLPLLTPSLNRWNKFGPPPHGKKTETDTTPA